MKQASFPQFASEFHVPSYFLGVTVEKRRPSYHLIIMMMMMIMLMMIMLMMMKFYQKEENMPASEVERLSSGISRGSFDPINQHLAPENKCH